MWPLVVLCIGIPVLALAVFGAFDSWRRLRGSQRALGVAGGILTAMSCIAFFGTALSALSGVSYDFEWPIGRANQIIQQSDGTQIVTHEPSGRIQVYDPLWHFQYGWNVDSSGGDFKAKLNSNDLLEVWARRGNKRFLFRIDGRIVETGTFSSAEYEDFPMSGGPGFVPTALPLWIFAHPFIAWAVFVVGMLLIAKSDPAKFKTARRT